MVTCSGSNRAQQKVTSLIGTSGKIQSGAKNVGTYMLYIHICLILVLSLLITEVAATKTKQLIFFAILLMLKFILNFLCDVIHDVFIKHEWRPF